MAFVETPRFPDTLALGTKGGPRFSTHVLANLGGHEQRNQNWQKTRGIWQAGLQNRGDEDTEALFAFFYAVAKGQANGWRLKAPGKGENEAFDQPLGTGTGSSQAYQLIKRYTSGSQTYDRTITKPVSGTVIVKVSGVPTTSFTVDTATGIVTMSATLGATLTASYQFDVPCRFGTDDLDIEYVEPGVYSWGSIPIYEIRDIS